METVTVTLTTTQQKQLIDLLGKAQTQFTDTVPASIAGAHEVLHNILDLQLALHTTEEDGDLEVFDGPCIAEIPVGHFGPEDIAQVHTLLEQGFDVEGTAAVGTYNPDYMLQYRSGSYRLNHICRHTNQPTKILDYCVSLSPANTAVAVAMVIAALRNHK